MTGDGTLVVIATYNERENIEPLVAQILAQAGGCRVLVVDDNSPDGTGEVAQGMAERDDRIQVLGRPRKMGLGTAYLAGFEHARVNGFERMVTMDADFSHHPRHLPSILSRASDPGVDIVIGSRYVPGGGVVGWGLYRRVLSFGANTLARTVLRLRPHDCTGAYRCYSRPVVEELALNPVVSHGYSALIEIIWQCQRSRYRIEEVPITFTDRELGVSKVSRLEILRGLTTVLRLRFRPSRSALPKPRIS
jgi:dolichol-phosphate mannosyltransferase